MYKYRRIIAWIMIFITIIFTFNINSQEVYASDETASESYSDDEVTGSVVYKDTGDDLDKQVISVGLSKGELEINLEVDTVPQESAYLVFYGSFGGSLDVFFNDTEIDDVGISTGEDYYIVEVPLSDIVEGTNTITIYTYALAWAEVDAVSLVLDGGDTSSGEVSDINFEDWTINEDSDGDYTDTIYLNTETTGVDTDSDLELISCVSDNGYSHFSDTYTEELDSTDETSEYSLSFTDYENLNSDVTGTWNVYSMIADGKKVLTLDTKEFYAEDSEGIQNFSIDFTESETSYTSESVTITAEVDDLFGRDFDYMILPDGTKVYSESATYTVTKNGDYEFWIVEGDGTTYSFTETVSNIDTEAPTLELTGESEITILEESSFSDPGTTYSDDYSGISDDGVVVDYGGLDTDCAESGTYEVTYSVEDKAGNTSTVTRTVTVKNKSLSLTTDAADISSDTVTLSGAIEYLGDDEIVEKGIVWGIVSNPTLSNSDGSYSTTDGLDEKSTYSTEVDMSDLVSGATYYVRTYAETADGDIVYGTSETFTASTESYGSFEFTTDSVSVASGSSVTLNIERTDGSTGEDTVYYRTVSGSAVAGTSFTESSGTVIFTDGDTTDKSITISTLADSTWEETNKFFYVEIYKVDGDGNIGSVELVTVTFTDDDDSSSIFSISSSGTYITYSSVCSFNSSNSNWDDNTSTLSLSSLSYWQETATSVYGKLTGTCDIEDSYAGLRLYAYVNGSWSKTSWTYEPYYHSNDDYSGSITTSALDISDATGYRAYALGNYAENLGGDYAHINNVKLLVSVTDNDTPDVTDITAVSGSYASGDSIYISVTFDEIVECSSDDIQLNLNLTDEDGNTVTGTAEYVGGSSTTTLVFCYTVEDGVYASGLTLASNAFTNESYILDLLGNEYSEDCSGDTVNSSIYIDSVTPTVTFSEYGNTTTATEQSTVVTVSKNTSSGATIVSTEYMWDTSATLSSVYGFQEFESGDELTISDGTGEYYLYIRVEDSFGNVNYIRSSTAFSCNNAVPTFTLTASETDWTNEAVVISVTDLEDSVTSDLIKTAQYAEGYMTTDTFTDGTDFDGTSFSVTENGMYTVYIETTMGYSYTAVIEVTCYDDESPTIKLSLDGTEDDSVSEAYSTITVEDDGDSGIAGIYYQWTNSTDTPDSDSADWVSIDNGTECTETDSGTWYLHVMAEDNAGNITYLDSESFIVDTDPITLEVDYEEHSEWSSDSITATITASKENLSYVILPDASIVYADENGEITTIYDFTENGSYSVVAVDEAGNTAQEAIIITTIDTDAPEIEITKSTTSMTNEDVTITVTANDDTSVLYDSDGEVTGYDGVGGIEIKMPDSDEYVTYDENTEYTFTATENGVYQVSVRDSLGNTTTRNIFVYNIDNTAPELTLIGDSEIVVGINTEYVDEGAEVTDDQDDDITYTDDSSTQVDTSTLGTYTITYTADDQAGNVSTITRTVNVEDITSPEISEISISTDEDTDYSFTEDIFNDAYTDDCTDMEEIEIESIPENGTLYLGTESVSEGDIITTDNLSDLKYVPDSDYFGPDSFSWCAYDEYDNASETSSVSITVSSVNDIPVVTDDTAETDEDTDVEIEVLANDSDVETADEDMVITVTGEPENGSYEITEDNTIIYTPDENWNGTDTIEYTITDEDEGSASGTITITVDAVNDAPVVTDDNAETEEDTNVEIDVLENDSDVETSNDDLIVEIVEGPEDGICGVTDDGTIIYIPDENWNGTDTIEYSVTDEGGTTVTGTVTITVSSVNDIPVVADDTAETDEDTDVEIEVLANDSDVETADEDMVITVTGEPENGSYEITEDNTITYTSDENWNGTDTIEYTITDEDEGSASGTITITVDSVNDLPVVKDDSAETDEDTEIEIDVLENDSDVETDNDELNVEITEEPENGDYEITEDNTIIYAPDENWNGTDTIEYTVTDEDGGSSTGIVTIIVDSVNDIPTAEDDTAETEEDTDVEIEVLANDSDVETADEDMVITVKVEPENGSYEITEDNTIIYSPDEDWNGTDNLTYSITDEDGVTTTAEITIMVDAVNDAPVMNNTVYINDTIYKEGDTVTLTWDEAFDVDGEAVTYELEFFDGESWQIIESGIENAYITIEMTNTDTDQAQFRVRAIDGSEAYSEYILSEVFTVDSTDPEISLSEEESDWSDTELTISIDATDENGTGISTVEYSISYKQDDGTWSDWSDYEEGTECTFSDKGQYRLKVRATDKAGNKTTIKSEGVYKIDQTTPGKISVTTEEETDNDQNVTSVTYYLEQNKESVSGITYEYSLDGGKTWTETDGSDYQTFTSNYDSVIFRAVSGSGLISALTKEYAIDEITEIDLSDGFVTTDYNIINISQEQDSANDTNNEDDTSDDDGIWEIEDTDDELTATVTGVDNAFSSDTVLKVVNLEEEDDDESQETLTEAQESVSEWNNDYELVEAYDISIWEGDTEVEPDGEVLVTITIPEELIGETGLEVVHISDDGTVTNMNAEISEDGTTLSFYTDHFSCYGIVQQTDAQTDQQASTDNTDNNNDQMMNFIIGLIVIAVIVAISGTLVIVKNKKGSKKTEKTFIENTKNQS